MKIWIIKFTLIVLVLAVFLMGVGCTNKELIEEEKVGLENEEILTKILIRLDELESLTREQHKLQMELLNDEHQIILKAQRLIGEALMKGQRDILMGQ